MNGAANEKEARGRRPLPWWRPEVSVEMLAFIASVYFAAAGNSAFWRAVTDTGVHRSSGGWWVLGSLAVAMVGVHAALLGAILSRWTAKPVLVLLLMLTAAAAYFSSEYAVHYDPSMVRNILRTDGSEASELFTPGLLWALALNGAVPAALVCLVRIPRLEWKHAIPRRLVFVGAMTGAVIVALLVSFQDLSSLMRNEKALRYLIAPGNYIASTARVLLDDVGEHRGPRRVIAADARLAEHPPSAKPHLLVIVVGETVRAQNWGLSGYTRQTTPQLAKLGVVNFRDVTACGSNTEVSVPCMFSLQGRKNYDQAEIRASESLLHVLERAGVKTLWRDNQTGCKGVCEGLAFESYREPRADPLCDSLACRDQIMLDGLHDAIEDNPGDVVVVLHQLGNHGPSYFRRYPSALRMFKPDCVSADLGSCTQAEIVNAYDNAVLATDDFLARTIRMLAQDASHDTALIYLSDHGESLGENNLYLHGLPYSIAPETQTRVPMVAWLSPGIQAYRGVDGACLQRRASEPTSHDNLFHSVLGLMQVESGVYDRSLDVFGACDINSGGSDVAAPR